MFVFSAIFEVHFYVSKWPRIKKVVLWHVFKIVFYFQIFSRISASPTAGSTSLSSPWRAPWYSIQLLHRLPSWLHFTWDSTPQVQSEEGAFLKFLFIRIEKCFELPEIAIKKVFFCFELLLQHTVSIIHPICMFMPGPYNQCLVFA